MYVIGVHEKGDSEVEPFIESADGMNKNDDTVSADNDVVDPHSAFGRYSTNPPLEKLILQEDKGEKKHKITGRWVVYCYMMTHANSGYDSARIVT
jgi:hypothetical protein